MAGARAVTWRDTEYLATGTHKGGASTTITDWGKDFRSCGVRAGLALRNPTTTSSVLLTSDTGLPILNESGDPIYVQTANVITYGHVVSVTEDTVVTDISFKNGDTYEIFKTTTYNSKLATHYEDKRAGHKVVDKDEVEQGILIEDLDLDEYTTKVFGPGQPWRH